MPDPTIPATAIDAVVRALDENDEAAGIDVHEGLALRVLKVTEESGEAAQALLYLRSQNPRKGKRTDERALTGELYDVALTALVAAASVTTRWAGEFEAHVLTKTARVVEAVD